MEVYMKFSTVRRVIEGRMDDTAAVSWGKKRESIDIHIVEKFEKWYVEVSRGLFFSVISVRVFEIICSSS